MINHDATFHILTYAKVSRMGTAVTNQN